MGVVPPLVGVAVNVTLVPAQIVEEGLAEMVALTGKLGFTIMVMPADVAGFPVAQSAFEVNTTVITSPFTNVVVENVEAVAPPIFTPFFFHW